MVTDAVRVIDMVTVGVDEPELLLVCVFVPLLVCEPEPVRVVVDDDDSSATEPVGVIELVPLPVGVLVADPEPLGEIVGVELRVGESDDDCAAVGGLQRKSARACGRESRMRKLRRARRDRIQELSTNAQYDRNEQP